MRIMPSKRITEKIMQLLEIKPYSSLVNSVITHSIKENSVIPGDVESLRAEAAKVNRDLQAQGGSGYTDDELKKIINLSQRKFVGYISPLYFEQLYFSVYSACISR